MKRIHLIISGDVQGVGYRAWAKREAAKLGLTGWVKNREDRTVELVAEGEEIPLQTLIVRCKHGPEVSWVKNVLVLWEKPTGAFVAFEVLL